MRDVRHYVLTIGREENGQPVRETRPLPSGRAAIVALDLLEKLSPEQLQDQINDLLAEQDRRRNGWRTP